MDRTVIGSVMLGAVCGIVTGAATGLIYGMTRSHGLFLISCVGKPFASIGRTVRNITK